VGEGHGVTVLGKVSGTRGNAKVNALQPKEEGEEQEQEGFREAQAGEYRPASH